MDKQGQLIAAHHKIQHTVEINHHKQKPWSELLCMIVGWTCTDLCRWSLPYDRVLSFIVSVLGLDIHV